MDNYLVSVVIPTKNRYETLFPLVKELYSFKRPEIEIVIQDNSDDNSQAISEFDKYPSEVVKYFHTKNWLSVVDNCDRAILNSRGEYVCFIGDDDALIPEIVEITQIMKKYGIDSCSCNYSLFRWPTALNEKVNAFEYSASSSIIERPNLKKIMKATMNNGIQNKKGFPGVYHGIVKKTTLNRIYDKTGSYFPGPSPDMANAFALALMCEYHINISIPFIIDGYSKASTGHMTEEKKHVGKLEDQSFLPKDTIDNWCEKLPKVWLPNTIWPQSAIQAIKRCGRDDLLDYINFNAIYIKISIMYPEFKPMCTQLRRKYSSGFSFWNTILKVSFSFLKNKLRRKTTEKIIIKDQIDIAQAIEETRKIVNNKEMMNLFRRAMERYNA